MTNTESKHTEGDWEIVIKSTCSAAWLCIVVKTGDGDDYEVAELGTIAVNNTPKSATYDENPEIFKKKREYKEIEANASLIASAPRLLQERDELLAALKDALPAIERDTRMAVILAGGDAGNLDGATSLIERVVAAITKAEAK